MKLQWAIFDVAIILRLWKMLLFSLPFALCVKYELSHLTQPDSQDVCGPIQDDEALFLYSLIRVKRISSVLEIGGLGGYSATNFVKAMAMSPGGGQMYTIDVNPVSSVANNHYILVKDAQYVNCSDFGGILSLGMVFYDCHNYDIQQGLHVRLRSCGIITDQTVVVMHDTGMWPNKCAGTTICCQSSLVPGARGYAHQISERQMVNRFSSMGYHCVNFFTDIDAHTEQLDNLPFRHGLSVCSMEHYLPVPVPKNEDLLEL